MPATSKDQRIAILLSSLGESFADSVMSQLPQAQASSMQQTLQRLQLDPPDEDEVTEVLDEFNRFMEFALANSKDLIENEMHSSASVETSPTFESTGDPFEDLAGLQDYQIAGALRSETGAAIAIVLGQLADDRVSAVMPLIPENVQQDAFLRLQASPKIANPLLVRIIEAVVAKASRLDQSAASDPTHLADEKTASLLRAMDRKTRTAMLSALEENDPDVAARVKDMLFVFEDILRFTDRSIQRLLAEVDTGELATTLKNADPAITERITSNLSKRAKATLLEEIEYLDSVSPEREEEAQKTVCGLFSQLDQAGDLEMLD